MNSWLAKAAALQLPVYKMFACARVGIPSWSLTYPLLFRNDGPMPRSQCPVHLGNSEYDTTQHRLPLLLHRM